MLLLVWLALVGLGMVCVLPALAEPPVKLATTTSTQNSGLLDVLLPLYQKAVQAAPGAVQVIAVGTGKALKLGESGDVDLVMVHAPEVEKEHLARGVFVDRRPVMRNYFVLLGPPGDPAQVRGLPTVISQLQKIRSADARFVSRGDQSGTHVKELNLWRQAGGRPSGSTLLEVGQGMGQTLVIANEKRAYTLSDEGTFLAFKQKLALEVLSTPEEALANYYAVMAVNPQRHPTINHQGALRLMDWLTSVEAARAIAGYTKHGRQLFVPERTP